MTTSEKHHDHKLTISFSFQRSYGRYHEEESEEAKYDFSYQVEDDYGNDFGHRASYTQISYNTIVLVSEYSPASNLYK